MKIRRYFPQTYSMLERPGTSCHALILSRVPGGTWVCDAYPRRPTPWVSTHAGCHGDSLRMHVNEARPGRIL